MTQDERLLDHLQKFYSIQPLESWTRLGIYRLSACIHRLRRQGHKIRTDIVAVQNQFGEDCHVAKYTLENE